MSIFLYGCNNEIVQGSNIIGNWENFNRKSIGGYEISSKTLLIIKKNNENEFNYTFRVYVSDQMYGTVNKLMENGYGKLSKEVSNKKWMFDTGILSKKNSYIFVPDDNWKEYQPKSIWIGHDPNRGSDQEFVRKN